MDQEGHPFQTLFVSRLKTTATTTKKENSGLDGLLSNSAQNFVYKRNMDFSVSCLKAPFKSTNENEPNKEKDMIQSKIIHLKSS